MDFKIVKKQLENAYEKFNCPEFIENDPIGVPHRFSKLQDIEIAAFFAATFAWGMRKIIINKTNELLSLMDNTPYDFILNHQAKDLKPFLNFKHRTFQPDDTLYFIHFLKHFYTENDSLEHGFASFLKEEDEHIGPALAGFHNLFFSLPEALSRTKKHVATPVRKSTCKRLCMFLRWMVRNDNKGVDLGLWKQIKTSQLLCPLDVHVERIARRLKLIERKQVDWKTTLELSNNLKKFDANDPVKYDFALFGIGVLEKWG